MKHKNSHLLVGYWNRVRGGRAVPDQTDIDPRAIKRMLASVFILDVDNPSRPIYRLAGTGLCERFGFELRGTGFLAHWDAQSAVALASLLRQALMMRKPVCVSSIGTSANAGMVELERTAALAAEAMRPRRTWWIKAKYSAKRSPGRRFEIETLNIAALSSHTR